MEFTLVVSQILSKDELLKAPQSEDNTDKDVDVYVSHGHQENHNESDIDLVVWKIERSQIRTEVKIQLHEGYVRAK